MNAIDFKPKAISVDANLVDGMWYPVVIREEKRVQSQQGFESRDDAIVNGMHAIMTLIFKRAGV